ncbi:hypothetical protein [Pseudoduganella sp.]|uniref:hypothetical protein n=1 Tax=Pseudoduganella sp. TaxID=1880898 RepID=UPI0035B4E52B
MEFVQRIIGKIVGEEFKAEELEMVTGGGRGDIICMIPNTTVTATGPNSVDNCDPKNWD